VVGVPAAGHRDVQVLAVQPGPREHDPDVGGGALGAVDRAGPAVLGVLGQVGGGQDRPAAAGQVLHQQGAVRAGAQDAVAVAVADMTVPDREAPVVAAGPQQVPGLPRPLAGHGDRAGDLPCGECGGAGAQVEGVDVEAGPGQHERVLPVRASSSPVRENAVQGGVTVRAGVEPAGGAVGGQRPRRPVAQREGGRALPGVAEPVDLGQLDAVPGPREGGEHPARPVDHADLRRVPDQHHLRPGPGGRGDQRVQVQCAGHGRLVEDHHRPVIQLRRPLCAG
jgi:hypothetical protein